MRRIGWAALALVLGCGPAREASTPSEIPSGESPPAIARRHARCGSGEPMTVRFYDAGQALAALVELPDGRRVLVDAGESPTRAHCEACEAWHARTMAALRRDVGGGAIDVLWITHPHSDHLGGAVDVLGAIRVGALVDNGRDLDKPGVAAVHRAALAHGTRIVTVDPKHRALPIESDEAVRFTPILPAIWPDDCSTNANDCSIALRVDACASSVLFTGDAEADEEGRLEPVAPVDLLQVGHHGSATSSSLAFLARARPRYAVISSGKRGEGTNRGFCHPRASVVDALTKSLGGPGKSTILAFDARTKCEGASDADWRELPASDRLFSTARDGDVVLVTHGDGTFARVAR